MKRPSRSFRFEKLASRYDEEVGPSWAEPFGRLLLEGLALSPDAHVLDVCCATGSVALEVLSKLGPRGHVVAMDGRAPLVDIARSKTNEEELGKRIFFRTERSFPKMTFANGAFDLVLCNASLDPIEDPAGAIAEMGRVASPGGVVRMTLPLAGSWQLFYDVADEVLLRHDKRAARRRLAALRATAPTPTHLQAWFEQAGLGEVEVVHDRFGLLFRSSEEFFYATLVELGPLGNWKRALGSGPEMHWIFSKIRETLDVYFEDRPLCIDVVAGRGHGVRQG